MSTRKGLPEGEGEMPKHKEFTTATLVSARTSPFMPTIFNDSTSTMPVPIFPSGACGGDSSRCCEGGVEAAAIAGGTKGAWTGARGKAELPSRCTSHMWHATCNAEMAEQFAKNTKIEAYTSEIRTTSTQTPKHKRTNAHELFVQRAGWNVRCDLPGRNLMRPQRMPRKYAK